MSSHWKNEQTLEFEALSLGGSIVAENPCNVQVANVRTAQAKGTFVRRRKKRRLILVTISEVLCWNAHFYGFQ